MTYRSIHHLVTLLVVATLWLPAVAHAEDTVIDFEDQSPGEEITNQYQSKGVVFRIGPDGPSGVIPTIRDVGGNTTSPTQALDIRQNSPGEFTQTNVYGRLENPRRSLKVFAGRYAAGSGKVTLIGYALDGSVVDSSDQFPSGIGLFYKLEVVAAPGEPDIAFFQVRPPELFGSPSAPLAIDDLSFLKPTSPPEPDFGLVWLNQVPGTEALKVKSGSSASTQIKINRSGGASAAVDFKAQNLPVGVSASFAPDPASGSSVTMTLTANKNASPVPNKPATITGSAPGIGERTVTIPVTVVRDFDLQLTGMEVTQVIQSIGPDLAGSDPAPAGLPVRDFQNPTAAVPYEGVDLVRDKRTTVRVFANVGAPFEAKVKGAKVLLRGFELKHPLPGTVGPGAKPEVDESEPLPGGVLFPEQGPEQLEWGPPYALESERKSPKADYRFTLPPSWTRVPGGIGLRAEIVPPEADLFGPSSEECPDQFCKDNNEFTLADIPFIAAPDLRVAPLHLANGSQSHASPASVFERTRQVVPMGDGQLEVRPYQAFLDISGIAKDPDLNQADYSLQLELLDVVEDWQDGNDGRDITIGIHSGLIGGTSNAHQTTILPLGVNQSPKFFPFLGNPAAVVEATSPFGTGHELLHTLGLLHASPCNGGGANGQPATFWPDDHQGWIHGIGFDHTFDSPTGRVIAPPSPVSDKSGIPGATVGQWYDLMSYCGSEDDSWISTRHWRDTLEILRVVRKVKERQAELAKAGNASTSKGGASARPAAIVRGYVTGSGEVRITRVKPRSRGGRTDGSDSSYRLIVRDSTGGVLSRVPMTRRRLTDASSTAALLEAKIPIGGSSRAAIAQSSSIGGVEIRRGNAVVARRQRSASAPKVKVLTPRGSSVLGRKRKTVVKWRATDRDGGELRAKVDYSLNGGRSWRTLATDVKGGRAPLPSRAFAASRRGRVRVRVSDGFNESSARSGLFRAVGRPPAVTITNPAGRTRIRGDAALYLSGEAYDDAGRPLGGKRLRWYAGKRRIGRGATISRIGLPAGRRRIRLVAIDRRGRRNTDSVRVQITPVPPEFLKLKAPKKLKRSRRRIRLKVQASIPSTLRVRGRRYRVGRKSKAIRVRVGRSGKPLNLRLRLSAGGKATRIRIRVPRG